jgi:hypothetical protein
MTFMQQELYGDRLEYAETLVDVIRCMARCG